MKILITGGNGFVAQRLAKGLIESNHGLKFNELILVDIQKPINPSSDTRVRCVELDLAKSGAIEQLFNTNIDIIFHLAAVVSGHAESDIDLGHKVNVEVTHKLLDTIRHKNLNNTKIVFTSSLGVYGFTETSDKEINEMTAVFPQSSYGAQKAMSELLINDYTRKGFIDGRIVRLPTVTVRSGSPNKAMTSFASGIVREPVNGLTAICPVSRDAKIWITSPDTIVANLIHASTLPSKEFGSHRTVNLPGITVSVNDIIESLGELCGKETVQLIRFEYNEAINQFVTSLPISFGVKRAMDLGFKRDENISQIIKNYIDFQLNLKSNN